MPLCYIHTNFFDLKCNDCQEEYRNLKGVNLDKEKLETEDNPSNNYKEFTEERAKKLYEEVFLQYLKKGNMTEEESIERSKKVVRKQCLLRNIEPWSWV